jgi:hypothetical protein
MISIRVALKPPAKGLLGRGKSSFFFRKKRVERGEKLAFMSFLDSNVCEIFFDGGGNKKVDEEEKALQGRKINEFSTARSGRKGRERERRRIIHLFTP